MNRISNKKLDHIMNFFLSHRNISDDELTAFASREDNLLYMDYLRAMQAIDYKFAFSFDMHLYDLRILNNGILYFYRKQQERLGFLKGFLAGVLSAVASGIIVCIFQFVFS